MGLRELRKKWHTDWRRGDVVRYAEFGETASGVITGTAGDYLLVRAVGERTGQPVAPSKVK